MTSATTCGGSTPTGQQLSYDAEGRVTSWQNTSTSPTSTANYLYDGSGNRVAALTTVNGTTTLTTYIGSIEEVQTAGNTTTTTTYYSVGGKRVAANVNGTFYYFGYDALGSQVAVFNSNGNLIGSQLYGPYGNQRYVNGSLPTSVGFTGQQTDSVTGVDYYNARYYDPATGQFLSVDSVQGNGQGTDPYSYAGGNPETLVDPTGHAICISGPVSPVSCSKALKFGAKIGGAIVSFAATAGAAVAGTALLAAGLIAFSAWLEWEAWTADAAAQLAKEQAFYYPKNGPKLQPGPTPTSAAYPGGAAAAAGAALPKILDALREAGKEENESEAGDNGKKRNLTNYGGAYLQLGNMVNGVFVPVAGYISPPLLAYSSDYHVEDQATDWAIAMIKWYNSQSNHALISAVRLDIYTYQAPCPACSGYYQRSGYVGDIAEHTGITNVDVNIWTSDGNPGAGIFPADY